MTDETEGRATERSTKDEDDVAVDDETIIGYRRPPIAHRFQPGTSGNPRGRPKGSSSRKKIIERVLLEKHRVDIDGSGHSRIITTLALVALQLRQKALEGNTRAFNEYKKLESQFVRRESAKEAGYLAVPQVDSLETWERIFGPKDGSEDDGGVGLS